MLIDQEEIDALLAQADSLAEETAGALQAPTPAATEAPAGPPPTTRRLELPDDPGIQRLLKIQVPVIVQLARRPMSIATIRKLAPGMIIEFEKSVDEDLDLLVNNRRIGQGTCVKVGENFGLRVTRILSKAQRIRSLGPES